MTNSRMKDFFDLGHLAATSTFEGEVLTKAIEATFERRSTPLPIEIPLGLSQLFAEDPTRQAQWSGFLRRLRLPIEKGSLDSVLVTFRGFLIPPVDARLDKKPFCMTWPPGGPWRRK